jgi:hypothetical protein
MDGSPWGNILHPTIRDGEGPATKIMVSNIEDRADVMFYVREGCIVVDPRDFLSVIKAQLPSEKEVVLHVVRTCGERQYGMVVDLIQSEGSYRLRDDQVTLQDLSSPSSFTWNQGAEIRTDPQWRVTLLRIRLPEDIVEQALFWRNWTLFAYGEANGAPTPRPLPRQKVTNIEHTVGPDHETLEIISEMYNTPVEMIRKLNPNLAQPLTQGQKVIVPLLPEKPKQGTNPNP